METLALRVTDNIGEIILNRPKKLNAMSHAFFLELDQALKKMVCSSSIFLFAVLTEWKG